ncbi:glutaredoxin family protein [Actinopolyspora xinjiangensis]|nr:glutaredoxin domain-containing protein [Actinopolyspora xinjiangensis]
MSRQDDEAPRAGETAGSDHVPGAEGSVLVYTRPGCPFCVSLRAGLRRHGVRFEESDIWQDERAAATVRELADGNETVPTVVIGPWSWSAVNPSAEAVRAAAAEHAPGALPDSEPGLVDGALRAMGLRAVPS